MPQIRSWSTGFVSSVVGFALGATVFFASRTALAHDKSTQDLMGVSCRSDMQLQITEVSTPRISNRLLSPKVPQAIIISAPIDYLLSIAEDKPVHDALNPKIMAAIVTFLAGEKIYHPEDPDDPLLLIEQFLPAARESLLHQYWELGVLPPLDHLNPEASRRWLAEREFQIGAKVLKVVPVDVNILPN